MQIYSLDQLVALDRSAPTPYLYKLTSANGPRFGLPIRPPRRCSILGLVAQEAQILSVTMGWHQIMGQRKRPVIKNSFSLAVSFVSFFELIQMSWDPFMVQALNLRKEGLSNQNSANSMAKLSNQFTKRKNQSVTLIVWRLGLDILVSGVLGSAIE